MTSNASKVVRIVATCWPVVLIIGALAVIYRGWLASGVISYGDWGFYSSGRMQDFWPIPSLWDGSSATGAYDILAGPLFPLLFLQGLLNHFGIGYALGERLVWIFPCVLIGALATYALALDLFSSRVAAVISAFCLAFNSYIVVIMTGGQFTVSAGNDLMPLILLFFYRAVRQPSAGRLALTSLAVAIQIMFDLRSTYLTLGVLLIFALFFVFAQKSRHEIRTTVLRVVAQFVAIAVVCVLIHAYWLLPGHYAVRIALPGGYDSTDWVYRLSYMQLSHGFTLFHPFWYQDTGTPRVDTAGPLFYALPIIVFAVLLARRITFVDLFLGVVAIVAIFLVKGDNPPAGNIYNWLFAHLPGFNMYRDPSKFYQPLALAYALLLGRVITLVPTISKSASRRLRGDVSTAGRAVVAIICAGIALLPIVPVATGTSWGTLAPQTIPAEYVAFNHFIDGQKQFFRVMWYPSGYGFATASATHPLLSAASVGQAYLSRELPTTTDATSWLVLPQAQSVLRALSVKYIVVADDPHASAQFTYDRSQAVKLLRHTFPSFSEMRIGNILLFVNHSYLPSVFVPAARLSGAVQRALLQRALAPPIERRTGLLGEYSTACQSCLTEMSVSQTRYEMVVHNAKRPFLLVLNQSFDPNWKVYVEPSTTPQPFWWTWTHHARPERDHLTVNGFANGWWINARGSYRIVVEYWPQRLVDAGWVICWLTIIGCLGVAAGPCTVAWYRRRARRKKSMALERAPHDNRPLAALRVRRTDAMRDNTEVTSHR